MVNLSQELLSIVLLNHIRILDILLSLPVHQVLEHDLVALVKIVDHFNNLGILFLVEEG